MPHKYVTTLVVLSFLLPGLVTAGVSPEQAARLSADLTPMGAEKAGNADETIPAWEGGIASKADAGFPDFETGGHQPDPYADDEILFTINAQNMDQYADKLTAGHKAFR